MTVRINGKRRSLNRVIGLGIVILILGLVYHVCTLHVEKSEAVQTVQTLKQETNTLKEEKSSIVEEKTQVENELEFVREENQRLQEEVSRRASREFNVVVTGYDLSVQSCGKYPGSPGYGITASGVSLVGHSLESARAIAVDPRMIPLGSKVRLRFNDPEWQHLNGIYTAVDTGGAINGNRIDLFFGDSGNSVSQEALRFGRRGAKAVVL